MIIVQKLLNQKDATWLYKTVKTWFAKNPHKEICRTDVGDISRQRIKIDILKISLSTVKL